MQARDHYSALLDSPEAVIAKFSRMLGNVRPKPAIQISFDHSIQKHNLVELLREAQDRICEYEQIYPYIKELCSDQTIDPALYNEIQVVLSWVLKLGRGEKHQLPEDIKDAWLTYIILLSCSMIDKTEDLPGSNTLDRLTRKRQHRDFLRENN